MLDKQESGDFPLIFLRIRHSSFSYEIRVVNNGADIKLNSTDTEQETFIGFPFEISILSDGEQSPSAQLSVQNVDRRIGKALLDTVDPARIDIEIYSSAMFDESVTPHVPFEDDPAFEYKAQYLWLTDVSIRNDVVGGTLHGWDYSQENYPGISATESRCPGLFW